MLCYSFCSSLFLSSIPTSGNSLAEQGHDSRYVVPLSLGTLEFHPRMPRLVVASWSTLPVYMKVIMASSVSIFVLQLRSSPESDPFIRLLFLSFFRWSSLVVYLYYY
ncbi:hypothetical protein BJ166DRAFT_230929 [Pestalotiopsis sp. NC0098]|nr:hypothetical protein BJ166DRAFT_230929 [Pestalotiopsis sp. NC0098]